LETRVFDADSAARLSRGRELSPVTVVAEGPAPLPLTPAAVIADYMRRVREGEEARPSYQVAGSGGV
jgi:hypothetical protein